MRSYINLNTATIDQLAGVPRVGEELAERIVGLREMWRSSVSYDELLHVEGMDNDILEQLRTHTYRPDPQGCGTGDSARWLQLGVRTEADVDRRAELCGRVARLARELLNGGVADNFFFMNKPPGLRLRFQAADASSVAALSTAISGEVTRWSAQGLVSEVEPGVYEPEEQLFGGVRSMEFVHALFTLDSLIWLDHHSRGSRQEGAADPEWLVSLAVLSTVFAGLDITGWEDLGVWSAVRDVAGRRLEGDKHALPAYAAIAAELRTVWSHRDALVGRLDGEARHVVEAHEGALRAAAAAWRAGYFCQPGATIGARAAAAFYVVFHWNRAAMPLTEQALLAESLAERIADDVGR